MVDMYTEFFGLHEAPFSIAPNPRYLYMSEQHNEALAHLIYGVQGQGGFVLLTGEVGTGKTTVCRCFLEKMPKNVNVAFVLNPKLGVDQLLETICDELGASYIDDKITIKEYIDCLNKHLLAAHSKGQHTVLIIDEAQNLAADVLEQLRLLTNLETDEKKLLQIVLLGQPELLDMFARPELRQLNQRVTARFHLGPLNRKEISAYVAHRLAVGGSKRPFSIFPDPVLNDLFRYSKGVPRLINVICDRAMLGAYVNETIVVDRTILRKAAKEVMGEQALQLHLMPRWVPWAAGATALTLLLGIGVALWSHYHSDDASLTDSVPMAPVPAEPQTLAKPAEVALPPAVAPVAVDPIVKLEWPSNVPLQQSERLAFQRLFSNWSVSFTDDLKKPCDFAVQKKLACFVSHGTFDKLKSFNMPAILKIQEQNTTFYAVMNSLDEKEAILVYAGEEKTIPLNQLKEKWTGEFTVLWQPPPNFKGEIGNGTIGPVVKWLNQQLQWVQDGISDQNDLPSFFDDSLMERVKRFQASVALPSTGTADVATLIHLTRILNANAPRLMPDAVVSQGAN